MAVAADEAADHAGHGSAHSRQRADRRHAGTRVLDARRHRAAAPTHARSGDEEPLSLRAAARMADRCRKRAAAGRRGWTESAEWRDRRLRPARSEAGDE